MPGYNEIKTQKALPIGSVQPYGGNITDIPSGWLLCNADELVAADYPLLARALRDSYGGSNFGGVFPNYTGTFRLPPTNDKGLADISVSYFGVSESAQYSAWQANKEYGAGDVVLAGGEYYSISINLPDTPSANGGNTIPSGDTALSDNGGAITYTRQDPSPNVPNSIDNIEAGLVVREYIGDFSPGFEPGDLGPPNAQDARTDILFEYEQEPDGTVQNIFVTPGDIPIVSEIKIYEVDASQVQAGTNLITGNPVQGDGVSFTVVWSPGAAGLAPTLDVIRREKGALYNANDQVIIPGSIFNDIGGTTPENDITVLVTSVGSALFDAQITGHSLIPGFSIKELFIVPRKLGRLHMPSHYHPGVYDTINFNDNNNSPGIGPTIFSNPTVVGVDFLQRDDPCWNFGPLEFCSQEEGYLKCTGSDKVGWWIGNKNKPNNTLQSSPFSQGVGRHALGIVLGGFLIKGNVPYQTQAGAHGIAVTSFVGTASYENLRDGSGRVSSGSAAPPYTGSIERRLQQLRTDGKIYPGHSIPFSDVIETVTTPNVDNGTSEDSNVMGPTTTLFDHAGVDFSVDELGQDKTVIDFHDHEESLPLQYNGDDMSVLQTLQVKARPNITPDNLEEALQIRFITRVPSLTIANLIRAY